MKAVSSSKAQTYTPSTDEASAAASAFVDNVKAWGAKFVTAKSELAQFVRENVKAKALGFVASDALNMSAFGVVFESNPGPGFIAVPGHVAEKLRDTGLRGEAYFPDMNSELGRKMMAKLNAVSRTAEQRPLLTGVPGVSPVTVEGGRLVLSRATETADGLAIVAAPSALSPQAEVVPFQAPKAERDFGAEQPAPAARKARMN